MTITYLVWSEVVQSLRVEKFGVARINAAVRAAAIVYPDSKDAGSMCVIGDYDISSNIKE